MFGFLQSDPIKKLEKQRAKMLAQAVELQRAGDLKKYAFHMEAIEHIEKELVKLQNKLK
jgi:Family of unknown function (DUF6435)